MPDMRKNNDIAYRPIRENPWKTILGLPWFPELPRYASTLIRKPTIRLIGPIGLIGPIYCIAPPKKDFFPSIQ